MWSENGQGNKMNEYKHWCGTCQIRVYYQRHYGKRLSWEDCPYTCEYAENMRRITQKESGGNDFKN